MTLNTNTLIRTFSLALLCFIQVFSLNGQKRIDRIEPPNWWVGMKTLNVQLMVHGDNVAELTPMINRDGVKLMGTIKTDNPNYLFIDLLISPNAKAGEMNIDFYAGRTLLETHSWHLSSREKGSAARPGFNTSDVIYLITPDRFANGDPMNDDVAGMKEKPDRAHKNHRHGGDIEGVRQHLGYIRDMGFTAIWLNPVLENDMQRSSYHGYATTDYYKVDPRFGTNTSFKQLVQEGNAIGIKHVMDMIPNHCGSDHPWMSDMPAKDWVNTWDTYTECNHRKTVANDPYASQHDIKRFTDGWFVRSMPDLNQRNPQMATYLIQNALWWVEYLGIAGIRIDTYPYSDPDFISEYCRRILEEYPNLNIVGEQWHDDPSVVAYWQKGNINRNGYESHLPSLMDFPVRTALMQSLNRKGGWDDSWLPVYETIAQDGLYADPMNIMVFPDNHDMSRIFTQINEDIGLYKLAIAFFATIRGIPQFFYGTEILMKNPGTDDHTIIRSDFPGGWVGDKINGFTGEGLTPQERDAQNFVRRLLQWRNQATVIHNGKLMHFAPKDNVYVYFRYDNKNKVMVILNKNSEKQTLALAPFAEMLNGVSKGTDVLTGKQYAIGTELELPSVGPVILELK